jgi:HEAT repeat protein
MMSWLIFLAALSPDDPEVSAALEKFKTDYHSKDLSTRVAAVADLSKTQGDKILLKLGSLLVVDDKDVRIAAAKGLEEQKENKRKASLELASAIAPNMTLIPVAVTILEELGLLQEEAVAPEVEKHFAKTDPLDIQKAAVTSAGKIRSASSVDPLIHLLKELELEAQQNGGGRGGGKVKGLGGKGAGGGAIKNGNAQDRDRAAELLPAVRAALASITKANCQDVKEWEAWWNEHKATFKVER